MKRLQCHYFGTTFGASEAPGHGESIYDGFGADFGADFVSRKFETSKIRKFINSKLPEIARGRIGNIDPKKDFQKPQKLNYCGERVKRTCFYTGSPEVSPGRKGKK